MFFLLSKDDIADRAKGYWLRSHLINYILTFCVTVADEVPIIISIFKFIKLSTVVAKSMVRGCEDSGPIHYEK